MSQELHATGPLTPAIDSAHFRTVLGHFGSGIAIITSIDDDEPVGMAVQSFSSLSLDPPYVMFAPAKSSTSWPRVQRTGRFCANILSEDKEPLSRGFARNPNLRQFCRVSPTTSARNRIPTPITMKESARLNAGQ